jgi:hypothetical protein
MAAGFPNTGIEFKIFEFGCYEKNFLNQISPTATHSKVLKTIIGARVAKCPFPFSPISHVETKDIVSALLDIGYISFLTVFPFSIGWKVSGQVFEIIFREIFVFLNKKDSRK